MSDVLIFAVIFVAFFVLRAIAATVFFFYILPETTRCPMCDQPHCAWQRRHGTA